MAIDPLQMDNALLNQPIPARRDVKGSARLPEREARPVLRDQVLLSQDGDGSYAGRRITDEAGEKLARAIRSHDEALKTLSQNIGRMKIPLETIVKNFPPFTSGDRTRVKLLREYVAIRKEIDQLTFPPPPEIARSRKSPALPAPLEPDATDSQIGDYLEKLDAAAAEIGGERGALAAETDRFLRKRAGELQISSPGRGGSTSFASLWSDAEAGRKSAEVGRQFALSVKQGVTAKPSLILRGMS